MPTCDSWRDIFGFHECSPFISRIFSREHCRTYIVDKTERMVKKSSGDISQQFTDDNFYVFSVRATNPKRVLFSDDSQIACFVLTVDRKEL